MNKLVPLGIYKTGDSNNDNWLESLGKELSEFKIPYTHTGYSRFYDQNGFLSVKPPWVTLNAIDLNKGETLWQVPLGEFTELTKKDVPKTGTENYGGPVTASGGLIFIAASKDERIRAFDKDSGEELCKHKLPAGGYATPSIYEVDNKQNIVIACHGGWEKTRGLLYIIWIAIVLFVCIVIANFIFK